VVRRRIFLLAALLVAAAPFVLAAAFAVVAYAPAFSDFRRALAVRALSGLMELPIAIDGDVGLVVADPLKLRISKVHIGGAPGSEGHRARPLDLIELSFPAWLALTGSFDVSKLAISGGRLQLTGDAGGGTSAAAIARLPSGFLNARVSDHLELRDIAIRYQDTSGWEFEWAIEKLFSQRTAGGEQIALDSQGALNGLPYSLSGRFDNPRGGAGGNVRGPFDLIVDVSGLTAKIGGSLEVSNPVAALDAQIGLTADSLATLLELLRLGDKMEGKGTLDAKLTGSLDSIRADRIALGFSDTQGRTFELTGGIADLGTGEGVDVSFSANLTGDGLRGGKPTPISKIDVTGFKGEIAGSLDRLVVKQIFFSTNVAAAELKHIGPIGLDRVVRDPDGRLGLFGIGLLQGPEDDPIFDLSGEITDVLDLSGINLAGEFNVSLLGVLMPQQEPQASDLGRLKGGLALSDASGSLRLEEFQANLRGTKLISLTIQKSGRKSGPKSNSQEAATERLALDIDLDIPDFSTVAARLGSKARTGAVGFTGELAFPGRHTSLRGEAKIGRTKITVEGGWGLRDGAPFVSTNLASDLLYITDLERGVQVYEVFAATDNEAIEIELEKSFVRQTRTELDLRVAELDANGKKAGNIHAEGHYLNGIAELEPLRMSYLEGTVDARVRADTNDSPPSVAIKGEIDKLNIGSLLTWLEMTPLVTGALDSTFDLSFLVDDRAAISKSLNGELNAAIWGGALSSRLIDLGGQNVVRWMFSGSGEAKLVCAAFALDFSDGRGNAGPIVVETDNVQVVGAGNIDLAADSIALSFSTRPKRPELIDVATPFSVSGKLTEPVIEIAPGAKVGRVARETLTLPFNLLGLLRPPARLKETHRPCVVEGSP
jgi:hypothetical protein